jgi:hypothetical protein
VSGGTIPRNLNRENKVACNLIVDVETQLQKFWELEEVEVEVNENEQCEAFFNETTSRQSNEPFEVALPFKRNRNDVANTYRQAFFALKRVERLPTELYQKYVKFMKEYREKR